MGQAFIKLFVSILVFQCFAQCHATLHAQQTSPDACPRPAAGGSVPEPEDLRSQNGVLKVDLTVQNTMEPDGSVHYCYLYKDGSQSPNLRLNPGDLLIPEFEERFGGLHSPSGLGEPSSRSRGLTERVPENNSDPV